MDDGSSATKLQFHRLLYIQADDRSGVDSRDLQVRELRSSCIEKKSRKAQQCCSEEACSLEQHQNAKVPMLK